MIELNRQPDITITLFYLVERRNYFGLTPIQVNANITSRANHEVNYTLPNKLTIAYWAYNVNPLMVRLMEDDVVEGINKNQKHLHLLTKR